MVKKKKKEISLFHQHTFSAIRSRDLLNLAVFASSIFRRDCAILPVKSASFWKLKEYMKMSQTIAEKRRKAL